MHGGTLRLLGMPGSTESLIILLSQLCRMMLRTNQLASLRAELVPPAWFLDGAHNLSGQRGGIIGNQNVDAILVIQPFSADLGGHDTFLHGPGFQDFVPHARAKAQRYYHYGCLSNIGPNIVNEPCDDHAGKLSKGLDLWGWIAPDDPELRLRNRLLDEWKDLTGKKPSGIRIRWMVHGAGEHHTRRRLADLGE